MLRKRFALFALTAGLVAAACGDDDDTFTANPSEGAPVTVNSATAESSATDDSSRTPAATNTPESRESVAVRALFGGWPNTDSTTLTVDITEILQGCAGKDCIPALDVVDAVTIRNPNGGQAEFAPVSESNLLDQMPIAFITINGQTRGYPIHILTWHEVVNDKVGGVPVAVTFCPLCNTALSFERTVDGVVLDFGVSGLLRFSDLIMFDRQTESWWQQAVGEAIAGEHAGTTLVPISTSIVSFGDFKATYPDADLLTADTGFNRDYGFNPYVGYDSAGSRPFLFRGEIDDRRDALERIVALRFGEEQLAVPFLELNEARTANVVVGGTAVAVFWAAGTSTALGGSEIAAAADVGAAVAYSAVVDGEVLAFEAGTEEGTFVDDKTGSIWSIMGLAVAGPLEGTQLAPVEHTTQFWFSWAAFFPHTEIWFAG